MWIAEFGINAKKIIGQDKQGLGGAEINSSTLKGSYKNNDVLAFIINFNWKF
jgi:hypothetical protein